MPDTDPKTDTQTENNGSAPESLEASDSDVPHPFCTSVVLTSMFELCPAPLLSKFRRVAAEWYYLSLAPLRSSFPLTFRSDKYVINYHEEDINDENLSGKTEMENFLEYYYDPKNKCALKPYRRLHVQKLTSGLPLLSQPHWNSLGYHARNFKLSNCNFSNFEEFSSIILQRFPNINYLSISDCYLDVPDNENFPDGTFEIPAGQQHSNLQSLSIEAYEKKPNFCWLKIFSHFLYLTSLSVIIPPTDVEDVLYAIKTLRNENRDWLPLKQFFIHPTFELSRITSSREKFFLCRQLDIPLETIRIAMHADLKENVIKDILHFHQNTLELIEAFESQPRRFRLKFPFEVEFPNLKILKISESLLENLGFLKYVPNLETLHILDDQHDLFTPFRNAKTKLVSNTLILQQKCLQFEKLLVLNLYYVVDDDDLRCLILWMPSINNLSMVLNDEQLQIVYTGWRNLQVLDVMGQELTDFGVTGIRDLANDDPNAMLDEAGAAMEKRNITFLQDLWMFQCWSNKLTGASVFDGFLKMPNLKRLEFYSPCVHAEKMILEEEAKEALREHDIALTILCFEGGCDCE